MLRTVSRLPYATTRLGAILVAAAGMAGCASVRTPVPVEGSQQDMSALAGKWAGSYESPVTGRSGGIVFTLRAERDTAFGNVDMATGDTTANAQPRNPGSTGPNIGVGMSRKILAIRFVRVDSGRVSGRLDPYTDPLCNCTVSTLFTGTVSGDTIRGTFTTVGRVDPSTTVTGTWKVRRER